MTVNSNQVAESKAPAAEARLSGNMGVIEVAMSVLAFSSPLTTVAGFIPVLLMFSGASAPAIYIGLTIMLMLFSVGFVRMSKYVQNPGGFYSFISTGLGKVTGLGSATLAMFGYMLIGFFGAPFFGVMMQSFVRDSLGGPDIPWFIYGIACFVLTTFLAYNRIDLSAKVLTTVMGLEILVVIVFDIFAFANGASEGTSATLALPSLGDATLGLALLFAAGNFLGFEATVIYRDEVKNPDRTIPRATYLAVAGIGIFYAIAAWAYIAFIGSGDVQATAEAGLATLFTDSVTALVGKVFADIANVLLFTSVIASVLSIQNVSARYGFMLSKDRALPGALGRVHPRHKSPYISALVVGVIWVIATIVFVLVGTDPVMLYTIAVGAGCFAIIFLLFIASLAVFVFFVKRRKTNPESVFTTLVAPILSFLLIGVITYLAITNYKDLIGGDVAMSTTLLTVTFATGVLGIIAALRLKSRRPEIFARLGLERPEDLLDASE